MAFLAGSGLSSVVDRAAPVAAAPATVLVDETFSGSTIADGLIRGTGTTCLTGATSSTSQMNACPVSQLGPVPSRGTTPGYLQLTDASGYKAGAVFYNRPIPASAGIDATFELYQYGGTGADGVTFFLVDGATQLTATGATGGSLGYAQRQGAAGVLGGYVGIGFDVFGNFYDDGEGRGAGCASTQKAPSTSSGNIAPNTVVVRGAGSAAIGYCYLASTTVAGSNPQKPTSSLPGRLSASTLATAKRTVHVVITPGAAPMINVAIDFDDGNGFQTVIANLPAPPGTPSTYKFGFSGSTGGSTDVHLLRNVVVGTVDPLAALNLVKQVNRQTALAPVLVAGSAIPYQFVVTNAGAETLHGLSIVDPAVGSAVCPAVDIPPAPDEASTVVCTGTHVITVGEAAAGVVVNTATATALTPSSNAVTSNQDSVSVPLRATLGLVKSVIAPGPYRVGQAVNYSYAVTNTGGADVANMSVVDNRVATITCPITNLLPAQTVTCTGYYTIRLQDIDANGRLSNAATASATTAIGQRVVSPAAIISIPIGADLSVTKVVDNASPIIGQNVTFTIAVVNLGPSPARTIIVSAPTPTGMTAVTASASVGTFDSTTGVWSIPALAVNQTATLTETSRVDTASAVVNSATITSAQQPDLVPANDSASVILNPVTPTTDIATVKSFDSDSIRMGDTATSTITVNNEGPFAATGVTVRDPLPTGATFVSAVGDGSYDPVTGIWTVGDVAFPGSASIRITGRADGTGFILNTAALATVSPTDINPLNDVATAPLTIARALADLSVGKTVRPAVEASIGQPVAFVVTATNNGPGTAANVSVDEQLPDGLAFVSANPEQGSFDPATGIWTIGALVAGSTVQMELLTTAIAAGRQTNVAVVSDPSIEDPDGSNNSTAVGLQIAPLPVPPADVGIIKTVSATASVGRGDPLTFVMTASNNGPNVATGVEFSDRCPQALHSCRRCLRKAPTTSRQASGTSGRCRSDRRQPSPSWPPSRQDPDSTTMRSRSSASTNPTPTPRTTAPASPGRYAPKPTSPSPRPSHPSTPPPATPSPTPSP